MKYCGILKSGILSNTQLKTETAKEWGKNKEIQIRNVENKIQP